VVAVKDRKTITLALQGGGAHGAFTWGVLDRLLEDGRLSIEGVSGTSAGAMNAVVLADGLHSGGPDGAREALEAFWRAMPTPLPAWDAQAGDGAGGLWPTDEASRLSAESLPEDGLFGLPSAVLILAARPPK